MRAAAKRTSAEMTGTIALVTIWVALIAWVVVLGRAAGGLGGPFVIAVVIVAPPLAIAVGTWLADWLGDPRRSAATSKLWITASTTVAAGAGGVALDISLRQPPGVFIELAVLTVVLLAWGALTARWERPSLAVVLIGDREFRSRLADEVRRRGGTVVASLEASVGAPTSSERTVRACDIVAVQRGAMPRMGCVPDELRFRSQPIVVSDKAGRDIAGRSVFENPLSAPHRVLKRALDIVITLVAIVATLPVLLVAAALIRIESPGPILFRQRRRGIDGKPFEIYKLRTMLAGAGDAGHREYVTSLIAGAQSPGSTGAIYKLTEDPRLTNVGRWLRRLSIDELPQLWNVLAGPMSLVGPRPPLPWESDLYSPEAWQRLRGKPGLTGLWQVSGRCELKFDEMVELDLRYRRDWSPALELSILLRTPMAVLGRRGAA